MPICPSPAFRRVSLACALTLASASAACSGEQPPAAGDVQATPGAPTPSSAAGPLLAPAPLVPLAEDVAGHELENYRLSLATVLRLGKAQQQLTLLGKQHPEVVNSMPDGRPAEDVR